MAMDWDEGVTNLSRVNNKVHPEDSIRKGDGLRPSTLWPVKMPLTARDILCINRWCCATRAPALKYSQMVRIGVRDICGRASRNSQSNYPSNLRSMAKSLRGGISRRQANALKPCKLRWSACARSRVSDM